MKRAIFRRAVSATVLLPLLFLMLGAFSTKAIVLTKPHGELEGIVGGPNYSWDSDWHGFSAGGLSLSIDFGFAFGTTVADVKFQGDGHLSYTNWPGTGALSFTETSGSATMAYGYQAWAKCHLVLPGWGFYAPWGWVQVIPDIDTTQSMPGLDKMFRDEQDCTNYLLGTSLTLSDEIPHITIYDYKISLEPIIKTNYLMGIVGLGLTAQAYSTVEGLRLSTSAGTFSNALPQAVTLGGESLTISNIAQTSRNSLSFDLTPDLSVGLKVGPIKYHYDFGIFTVTIPVSPTEFSTTAASITFTRTNLAKAITLAASQTLCVGTNAGATLNGVVNPGELMTTAWFEWGTSTNYGQTLARTSVGDGTNDIPMSCSVTGLAAGLMYHYRMVGSNSMGLVFGADQRFGQVFLTLNGESALTRLRGTAFTDPGFNVVDSTTTRTISAGYSHSLALRSDGMVIGWGDNTYGQTNSPGSATNVVAIAAGGAGWGGHSLALKADRTVIGWGSPADAPPASATNLMSIAAGVYNSLALRTYGTLFAWGDNNYGQNNVPASATNVVAIAMGGADWGGHGLALKTNGTIVGWGDNEFNQATGVLNPLSPYSSTGIVAVAGQTLTNVVAIAAGGWHSLALKADGTVVAWGAGTTNTDSWPHDGQAIIPANLTNVVAVAAGTLHSLALRADGTVVGWGLNDHGQTTIPPDLTNVVAVAAGNAHSLALKSDGTVVAWGYNNFGQTNVPAGLRGFGGAIGVSGSVNTHVPGSYTLTYWATNALGTVASATLSVRVVDAPSVTTLPASSVFSVGPNTSATLNGTVNPNAQPSVAWFEWGTNASYGHTITAMDLGGGWTALSVSNALTDLAAGVIYHYRLVASNAVGGARGASQVFWSPALTLNSVDALTNRCYLPFVDPGAQASPSLLAIAAGGWHSLALKADGTVVGWGENYYGESTIPAGLANVVAIAAGYNHSLALKADGTVVGWGENYSGQTNGVLAGSNVVTIAGGFDHSLALMVVGTFVVWGDYEFGQTNSPAGATNVMAIAADGWHSLALKADGTVVGWGAGGPGTSGLPHFGQTTIPASATNVMAIAAGRYHSLTLKADGTVVGWGDNESGQITIPASVYQLNQTIAVSGTVNTNVPGSYMLTYSITNALGATASATRTVLVADAPSVTTLPANSMLSVGTNTSATLNGTVNPNALPSVAWFEWGANTSYGHTLTARDVGSGWSAQSVSTAFTDLAAGLTYHYRLVASNSVGVSLGADQAFCPMLLTLNGGGRLTNECGAVFTDPGFSVADPLGVKAIAAGGYHNLALMGDGTVIGWGMGYYGQITPPANANNLVAVAAGYFHSLALKADGTLIGWGAGTFVANPHVDNDYVDCGQAIVPASATNVVAIAAGGAGWGAHSLALKADGTVIGWGSSYGSPPASANNVKAISASGYNSLALRTNDTVVAWGDNNYYQTNVPGGLSNAVAIAMGGADWGGHSLALKPDGTVIGWGDNEFNQATGVPDTNSPYSPTGMVAVAGQTLTNVVAIAAGGWHSLALKADGTVVAWGAGTTNTDWPNYGQAIIPANLSNVVAIAAGAFHSLALKADGTVVGWGDNSWGQTNALAVSTSVSGTVITNALGSYTLTYWATNELGAVATATRTVIVRDTIPPVLACPTNLVVTALPGQCASNVTFTVTATDNADPAPGVSCVPGSGSSFPVGRTTVLCTAWDVSGNTNTCAFTVSVYPTQGYAAGEIWTPHESNRNWNKVASSADGTKLVATVTGGQIYTSTDSGVTWTPRAFNTNWQSVASSEDGTKLVAVVGGYIGGVFRTGQIYTSRDSGTNWTAHGANQSWFGVASSTNGTKLIALAYNDYIYTSTDSGTTWAQRGPHTGWLYAASSDDGTKLVATTDGGPIYTSTDSGTNWTSRETGRWWGAPASSADGSKLALPAGAGNQIYTSTNFGTNWTAREISRNWVGVASSADGIKLVAVDNGGRIYTSIDSGLNWTPRENNRAWQGIASSADGTKLVAVVAGAQIYTSSPTSGLLTNPPTIFGANNQVVAATGPGGAVVTFNVTAANTCQPSVPISCTPVSGTMFPLGTNIVTCVATDAFGVTNTAVFTVTVVQRPVFGGCSVAGPGQFRLQGTGTAGLTYTVQTSTNLVTWLNHTNVVAGPGGLIECLECMETDAPTCFYRLRWP